MLEPETCFRDWRGSEIPSEGLSDAWAALHRRFPALRAVLDAFPLDEAIDLLAKSYDPTLPYSQLKPPLAAQAAKITSALPELPSRAYGLAVLLHLAGSHEQRWGESGFRDSLRCDFADAFGRMKAAATRGGNAAFELRSDSFAKDLAVALHRLLPLGSRLVDPGSGLPKNMLLSEHPVRLPGTLALLTLNGGFSPYAEFHTHDALRHRFTAASWHYAFERLPALFSSRPTLKGVFGGGWFFDPALERIGSPMRFVRDVCHAWGGRAVRGRASSDVTEAAIILSPERRKLLEEGVYSPVAYFMVIPKRKIIARASANKK